MPAGAIIGGASAVAGGISSGKGAKKAAQIQAAAQEKQTAALQAMYQDNKALMTPTFNNGSAAQSRIQTMLGLPGGDGSDPSATLAATPGYQFAMQQTLASNNANAYASGMGNSGAAIKSAQDRANGLAQQNYNTYVGQLGGVADRGVTAMGGLVSQGNTTTNAINQSTQAGADAASANAAYQGNNLANIIKGVANAGGQSFNSSYAPNTSPGAGMTGATPGIWAPQPVFDSRGLNTQYFGGR
jgi:hypothetical protein